MKNYTPIVILIVLIFGLIAGNKYLDDKSNQRYLEANQVKEVIELPVEQIVSTEAPTPTVALFPTQIPTQTPPAVVPSFTPTQSPTISPADIYNPLSDYVNRMNKCLSDKENDPLTKQIESDREIYNNPNTTREEQIAAIGRISSNNWIIGQRYDCFNTSHSSPTARCNDGTYSYSQHYSGTCSYHGGVSQWFKYLVP